MCERQEIHQEEKVLGIWAVYVVCNFKVRGCNSKMEVLHGFKHRSSNFL